MISSGRPHFDGHVEGFVNDALAQRAIADADGDDAPLPDELLREGEPGRHRNDAALDAIAEELPAAQMLAAAEPGAYAGTPAP